MRQALDSFIAEWVVPVLLTIAAIEMGYHSCPRFRIWVDRIKRWCDGY
jgi:hypothetical protein